MARKYTYETTLDLGTAGELDVKVRFECPDHELVEGVEVVAIEGHVAPFDDELAAEIVRQIEAFHDEDMILRAIADDFEARTEAEERRQERAWERAQEAV